MKFEFEVEKVFCPKCGKEISKIITMTEIVVKRVESYSFTDGVWITEDEHDIDELTDKHRVKCSECGSEIEEIVVIWNGKKGEVPIDVILYSNFCVVKK